MSDINSKPAYHELIIEANNQNTEIWIGDDKAHFIQKETGKLTTSLLPGKYTVEFGLGSKCYSINLDQNKILTELQIISGPSCTRPIPNV